MIVAGLLHQVLHQSADYGGEWISSSPRKLHNNFQPNTWCCPPSRYPAASRKRTFYTDNDRSLIDSLVCKTYTAGNAEFNLSRSLAPEPALSWHAHSPPITVDCWKTRTNVYAGTYETSRRLTFSSLLPRRTGLTQSGSNRGSGLPSGTWQASPVGIRKSLLSFYIGPIDGPRLQRWVIYVGKIP